MTNLHGGELERRLAELDACVERARGLAWDLSDEALNWRPEETRWSVAQCLDHLNKSALLYLDEMPDVIADAHAAGLRGPSRFRRGLVARLLLYVTEPPPRVKLPAPSEVVPEERFDPATLQAEYERAHRLLRETMLSTQGLDLGRVKMRLPEFRALKMRLGEIFAMLNSHERRHLWQAEQVTAVDGFPR